ncbi:MAG: hypothetical protein IPJ65_40505, partial [Archangiaceae bacterium]|nr:hypothetical protein [Archangiaceae bacterium]
GQLEMMSFVMVRAMEAVLDAALLERPDYLGDETFLAELTRLATAYLQRA